MRTDMNEAIDAASDARHRATAQLDAAERAARACLAPETMAALLAALHAQAALTDAVMKLCSILAEQPAEAPQTEAMPLASRLN